MAASVASEIEKTLNITPELVRKGNGIFDVIVDGRKIFSKYESFRFPEVGEIVRLIEER